MIPKLNKRGQFQDVLYIIVTIFVIGIIFFFFNHISNDLYSGFDAYFGNTTDYVDSPARTAVQDIQEVENTIWDWAFLAIFIGFLLQMIILAYSTRISIIFYWLFALIGLIGLGLGVILSNIWQKMVEQEVVSGTLTRFTITNMLLGTYYPIVVTGLILIIILVIFGKPSGGGEIQ